LGTDAPFWCIYYAGMAGDADKRLARVVLMQEGHHFQS
jgi:hypothetical protein